MINAYRIADLLDKALDKVNYNKHSNYDFRDNIFNCRIEGIVNFDVPLTNYLDKLDDEYYSMDEDLEKLLIEYLE